MTLGTLIRTAYGYGPANLDFLTNGGVSPDRQGLQLDNTYGLGRASRPSPGRLHRTEAVRLVMGLRERQSSRSVE
jgi:hypothetical protein